MRKQPGFICGIFTLLWALPPVSGLARGEEIRWFTDHAAAMREAAARKRPIFLDVWKSACFPCDNLERTTYRDPAVIKYINDNFVALKINGLVNNEPIVKLQGQLINLFPTLAFITTDEQVLYEKAGYVDAAELLRQAEKAAAWFARTRPVPFRGTVKIGPGVVRNNVWPAQHPLPAGSAAFSFQPLNAREERSSRARDMLVQAVDSYRKQQWLQCLDQSRAIIAFYPDLPQSVEARMLEQAIGIDKLELMEKELTDNLAQIYWELAQMKIRQNQIPQAIPYMAKILQACPTSRHAPAAQEFLRSVTNRTAAELHATEVER